MGETGQIICRIDGLISGYGKKTILHGISIEIERAKISALLGRNGVGKTTLLNTLIGIIKPLKGEIYYENRSITGLKPHVLSGMGISYVPQGKSIFPYMSVEEHLEIGAWILRDGNEKELLINKVFGLFPRLRERRVQEAGTLSGGERQMLSISRALMSKPKFLILDEPSFGLAPILVNAVFTSIEEISKENVTIFVVEQNAKKVLQCSDYGFIMDMGKIIYQGSSKDLIENGEVKLLFLGGRRSY